MSKIKLPIDTKSLYYNIFNDNLKGHTCTVATPIKQGKSLNKDLNKIYSIPKQIDFEKNETLLNDLTKNSKSVVKINNVFVFDKLMVNGIKINTEANYCLYIKEEIDKTRIQFGRIKLHYPISLKNKELNIDNRKVINAISDIYKGFAFIIEGFEYDLNNEVFDFKLLLVGYKNIPYSKVFINNKGVGSKYNQQIRNHIDIFDTEIIALRKIYGQEVSIDNYEEYINKAQTESKEKVCSYLDKLGMKEIRIVSNDYPYSLYDIQYYDNKDIKYAVVFGTYTSEIYFSLTNYQNQFINLYNNVDIFVVTDFGKKGNIVKITKKDLMNYSATINVVRFVNHK